jgi:hypothetical protein
MAILKVQKTVFPGLLRTKGVQELEIGLLSIVSFSREVGN